MVGRNWPSHEEWAKQRRTLYAGIRPPVDRRFSAYASPKETAAAITALRRSFRQHGRLLREAKRAAEQVLGEPWDKYERRKGRDRFDRWAALPRDQQDIVKRVYEEREARQIIERALKLIAEDHTPWLRSEGGNLPALREIVARYNAVAAIDTSRCDEGARRRKEIELSANRGSQATTRLRFR